MNECAFTEISWELVEGGVLLLTLDRPDHLNAFTVTMCDELIAAFDRASGDDEVKAIVVTGRGRTFCAGMDLGVGGNVFGLDQSLNPTVDDMSDRIDDPAIKSGLRDTGGRVSLAIYRCTKPTIAAINGPAVGIGATMTLPMDVRLASDKARIGFVFGRIGIVNEACSSWYLPRLVGISQALEWLYTARILTPQEACDGGLIREIVSADELLDHAITVARSFVDARSPVSTALIRQMLYRGMGAAHPLEAHRAESLAMWYTSFADGVEGVQAFLDKREPQFMSRVSSELPTVFPPSPVIEP